jgi:hypothetical protein
LPGGGGGVEVEGDGETGADGEGEAGEEDDGGVAVPVHATPLRANADGDGLLPVHDPLNPNDTVAPVPIGAL